MEDKEVESVAQIATSMSPVKGSQGALEVDLSSQEEALQKESQDIDWDLTQEEDGQNSRTIEMELDKEKENDKAKSALNAVEEEKEVVIVEKDQMKDTVEEIQVEDNSTSVEG
jgi:hypothetical protein